MKKILILAIGAALVFGGVLPILASDNTGAEAVEVYTQRLEAQKAYLDALVEDGKLTQEQADLAKKNIELRIEYLKSDDFDSSGTWGPGFRGGRHGGRFSGAMMGRFGGKMMGGYCGVCPWGYNSAPPIAQ